MIPNVSIEVLLCALALSEEGNLSRTAHRLHMSASNVSRKVKSLQTSSGVHLFERGLSGYDLTDEGRSFMPELRVSIRHMERGFDRAHYQSIHNQTPFRIGRSPDCHGRTLVFLEKHMRTPNGFSNVSIKSATSMQLKTRVLRGELQAGFGVTPMVDSDLRVLPLMDEGFSLCIPDSHALKGKVRLAARDVANERLYWIPRSMHPALYDEVTGYLRGVGHDTHTLGEARTVIEAIDCAANGLGVALVPHSAERFRCPGVLFKPLTDRQLCIETALFVRRDQMNGVVGDFIEAASAQLRPRKSGQS